MAAIQGRASVLMRPSWMASTQYQVPTPSVQPLEHSLLLSSKTMRGYQDIMPCTRHQQPMSYPKILNLDGQTPNTILLQGSDSLVLMMELSLLHLAHQEWSQVSFYGKEPTGMIMPMMLL